VFALYACDNPVAGADNVTAFKRVDPAMQVHYLTALFTLTLTGVRFVRMTKIPHHFPFPVICLAV
jgi:hypothetical protein